ncbi:MAG: hypothetical protein L6R28_22520 [Planctomycetes bacterium]|nr:hypothetical protein [Planctomycetota bacterium]
MAEAWTPKERVRATLAGEIPDRVPLAFWGSQCGPHDVLYWRLLEYFGLPRDDARYNFRRNKGHTVNFYDDRVLDQLGTDFRYVWSGSTDVNSPDFRTFTPESGEDQDGEDLYGVGFRATGYQVQVVPGRFPIHQETENPEEFELDPIEAYQFPDPAKLIRVDELKERLAFLKARYPDYAIAARAVNSFGLFEQTCHLIGHENTFMSIALNPPVVHRMAERLLDFFSELYERYLAVCGPYVDLVELSGDDYAGTFMSMVSAETYVEFYMKHYRELIRRIKSWAPHAKVMFHSDGNIMQFVEHWIDSGADVIHSCESNVGNDHAEMKRRWGERVVFMGALDVKTPMQRSVAETEAEIRRKFDIFKPGGHYILAPENHLQRDCKPECLHRAYECARAWGAYQPQPAGATI